MSARLLVLLAVTASLGAVAVVGQDDAPPPQVPPSVSDYSCSDTTYTNGSQYEKNLDDLVSALSTAAAASGNGWFRDGSVGAAPPDQATGLIMCYADANVTQCLDCLRSASLGGGEIRRLCPGSRGMSVHYGECLLRYSDASFLGAADTRSFMVTAPTPPPPDAADAASMNRTRWRLLSDLAASAADQPLRFRHGYWPYLDVKGRAHLVYGLVQCTRDLRPSECSRCLMEQLDAVSRVLTNSTRGSAKGWSCYMRFQLNQPIDIIPGMSPAPAPAPVPVPAPSPPDSPQPSGAAAPPPGSKQGSKTPLVAALAAAAWTVAALVVAGV